MFKNVFFKKRNENDQVLTETSLKVRTTILHLKKCLIFINFSTKVFQHLIDKNQSRNEFFVNLKFVIFRWFGIELDEPLGRHDGTVEEIRYFAAADDHGVFVTDARLIKLHNQPPKPGK